MFPFEVGDDEPPGAFTRMGRAIRKARSSARRRSRAPTRACRSRRACSRARACSSCGRRGLIDPYWAVEFFAGLSPRSDKDIFLAGGGFVLRLAPGAVIGPYANLGLGAAHISPTATNFVDAEETLMALAAGGGLEITLKKQITVRLDARNWTLFNQNHSTNGQE